MWINLYPDFDGKIFAPIFSIGDHDRITKKKKPFVNDTLKDGRMRFSNFQNFY